MDLECEKCGAVIRDLRKHDQYHKDMAELVNNLVTFVLSASSNTVK